MAKIASLIAVELRPQCGR